MESETKDEMEKQLHSGMEISKGVYLGDIDDLMKTVESQMPIVSHDQIYLWELEKQGKIFLVFTILGLMLFTLGVLI